MKNQYKERQRQIEKSVRNDWNQSREIKFDYFSDEYYSISPEKKKKSKLVIKNGKFTRVFINYDNGIPMDWGDLV